jgi:hypothetical protein
MECVTFGIRRGAKRFDPERRSDAQPADDYAAKRRSDQPC